MFGQITRMCMIHALRRGMQLRPSGTFNPAPASRATDAFSHRSVRDDRQGTRYACPAVSLVNALGATQCGAAHWSLATCLDLGCPAQSRSSPDRPADTCLLY